MSCNGSTRAGVGASHPGSHSCAVRACVATGPRTGFCIFNGLCVGDMEQWEN